MQKPPIVVPPGGFPGFAQQTPATQRLFAQAGRLGGRTTAARRRRKKKTTTAKAAKRPRNRTKIRAKRLVKGSAAAKAYMAKIRRKRKR